MFNIPGAPRHRRCCCCCYPALPSPPSPSPAPSLPSPTLLCPALSCPILSCRPLLFCPVLPSPALPFPSLLCSYLHSPTLPYPTLPYPMLSCRTYPASPSLPFPVLLFPSSFTHDSLLSQSELSLVSLMSRLLCHLFCCAAVDKVQLFLHAAPRSRVPRYLRCLLARCGGTSSHQSSSKANPLLKDQY